MNQIGQELVKFKCERKVVREFALETTKLMHSLYPIDRANKCTQCLQKFPSHQLNNGPFGIITGFPLREVIFQKWVTTLNIVYIVSNLYLSCSILNTSRFSRVTNTKCKVCNVCHLFL